ncbi:hypothetical protein [Methylobacterium nigriterrae]|uniref:hypothetical protein n=1 Tax=Methylobacterium nigriterrae TaxID=3127512 RepID=UPI0030132039
MHSKAELVARASARAARYNQSFSQSKLDEWIKQGLVQRGERQKNQGLRPIYVFSRAHYRRVLQIARLRAGGISDRDAILLQLFVRGYSIEPHDIRTELATEYARARAKLNAPVRSVSADTFGPVRGKRRESLLKQMGQLDPRFDKAGVGVPNEFYIQALRLGRMPDTDSTSKHGRSIASPFTAITSASTLFSGMFYDHGSDDDPIKLLISLSTDAQIKIASGTLRAIRAEAQRAIKTGNFSAVEFDAASTAYHALYQREFLALMLVFLVKMSAGAEKPIS